MDRRLRVGLVGAGSWARRVHAPGLVDHPATVLSAVWTPSGDTASALAEEHGARVYTSFEELLDSVDAVSFAVPPSAQGDLAVVAARAGKHLILEKPLAATVEQAHRVTTAVTDAGVVSLLVLTLRYAQRTRDWLAALADTGGWSGGSARWLSGALLGARYGDSAWRQELGALGDIGPHVFDLLDAALGPITSVAAASRDQNGSWHVLLHHDGGATSSANFASRLPITPTAIEFAVYGDAGLRTLTREPNAEAASFTALLDDFAALVESDVRDHPCDVHRGLHLQRILARVRCLSAVSSPPNPRGCDHHRGEPT